MRDAEIQRPIFCGKLFDKLGFVKHFAPLPSPSATPSPRRGKAILGSTLEGELSFSQEMTEGGIQNHPYKFKLVLYIKTAGSFNLAVILHLFKN